MLYIYIYINNVRQRLISHTTRSLTCLRYKYCRIPLDDWRLET